MKEAILLVIGAGLGAFLTYLVRRQLFREQRPTKKIRCRSTYCVALLTNSANPLADTLELRVDGEKLHAPVVINYTLECMGNQPIKDCFVHVHTKKEDQIVRQQVLMKSKLHCERIQFEEESHNSLKLKMSYLNPGDWLIIALLVSPCEDARCVRLEVDAEGLEFDNQPMYDDCSVHFPDDLHSARDK